MADKKTTAPSRREIPQKVRARKPDPEEEEVEADEEEEKEEEEEQGEKPVEEKHKKVKISGGPSIFLRIRQDLRNLGYEKVYAEVLGTFILVFVGAGSVLATSISGGVNYLTVGLA